MPRRSVQNNAVPAPNSKVGYCSPPEATRFKKGVSGNPRGRPKGSLNVTTVLTRTLREKVAINENGRRRTVTKLEAALKQLVNQAAAGDLRALRHLTALACDAEAQQNMRDTQRQDLSELDRDVMQGILQRFQDTTEQRNSSEGDGPR
ncbi:MAG: DUF5681 domain-containing protein [Terriglobales bacterium]|jgi:hypothetical protein